MIYLALSASIVLFLVCMKLCGVVESIRPVFANSRAALAVMRSTELSDLEKEAAVQKAALGMFKSFFSVTLRILVTLAVPAAFVWAGNVTGLYTLEGAIEAASDWMFLIVSSLVVVAAFIISIRRGRGDQSA